MAIKSKIELTTELPVLIKSKGLVSPTKTTGDTLRQMLQDIIDSMGLVGEGVPVGAICEWFSTVDTIPQYWVLCDGRFGTPDLRDKFVIGAAGAYPINATGGSANHNHGGTVGGHALQLNEIPAHSHTYNSIIQYEKEVLAYDAVGDEQGASYLPSQTSEIGGGVGGAAVEHTHPLNLTSATTLPPYHSLVYMMFMGPSFTEDTEVPSPVLNLSISLQTISSFLVSWTASSDNVSVVGYDVYVNGAYRDTTSSLSYSVTGLDPSTTYVINVKARDASGNNSIDSTINGTTLGMPAPTTNWFKSSYATGNGNTNDYVIYKDSNNNNVVKNFTRTSNNNSNPCESISHYGIVEIGPGADPCTPTNGVTILGITYGYFDYYSAGYISRTSTYFELHSTPNPNYLLSIIDDKHFQVGDTGTYRIRFKGLVRPEGNSQSKLIDLWIGKNQQAVTEVNNAVGLQKIVSNIGANGGAVAEFSFDNEITINLNAGDTICAFARLVSGQGLQGASQSTNSMNSLKFYIDKIS